MNNILLKEQVEIIRQAFGYINTFKNQTFVIKIDGTLIEGPFFPVLIKDLVLLQRMGIRILIVPGTRSRIDEVLSTYNIKCRMVDGIRISPPEAVPFIKMAAFDVSNRIMTLLAECGAHAVIGNWVRARSIGVRNGIDYQSSGIVERLQTDILENVLSDGLIPIFPNIGWNAKGKPYNISSNELSFTLSTALRAAKLFFLTNKQQLNTSDFTVPQNAIVEKEGVISQLTVSDAAQLIEQNSEKKGCELFDLVTLAHQACREGVKRVHILDGSAEGMVLKEIFSNRGLGTMVYANQYENIRPITSSDIPEVLRMMQPVMDDTILVPRNASDLEEDIDDYCVYEVDGTIHGCGALHIYEERQGEIGGLVVDDMYTNLGIGKKIISYLIEQAYTFKLKSVFALTTQTSDWFAQLGFSAATVDDLPPQRRERYDKNRNSLIFRLNLKRHRTSRPASVE